MTRALGTPSRNAALRTCGHCKGEKATGPRQHPIRIACRRSFAWPVLAISLPLVALLISCVGTTAESDQLDEAAAKAFCTRPTGQTAGNLRSDVAAFTSALQTARPQLDARRREAFDRVAAEFADELAVLARGQQRHFQSIDAWVYPPTSDVTSIFQKYNVTPKDVAGERAFDDNNLGFIWIRMATDLDAAIKNKAARQRVDSCFKGAH